MGGVRRSNNTNKVTLQILILRQTNHCFYCRFIDITRREKWEENEQTLVLLRTYEGGSALPLETVTVYHTLLSVIVAPALPRLRGVA